MSRIGVPAALYSAHKKLTSELERAIAEWTANQSLSDPQSVCRSIECFVDELCKVTGARDELQRRASFVVGSCRPGSAFHEVWDAALKSYGGSPRNLRASKIALDRLRQPHEGIPFAAEIHQIPEDIDRFLEDDKLNPSEQAREAFNEWRSECHRILRKAAVLEVDGCWYLWRAVTSSVSQPTTAFVLSGAFLSLGLGGAVLESVREAANSMADWVADTESPRRSSSVRQRERKARRPKRSTERVEARDKIISALTEHHKYEHGSCLNLMPIGVTELAGNACVAKSSASRFFQRKFAAKDDPPGTGLRNYRTACSDGRQLEHSIKILRDELTPGILWNSLPVEQGDKDSGKDADE